MVPRCLSRHQRCRWKESIILFGLRITRSSIASRMRLNKRKKYHIISVSVKREKYETITVFVNNKYFLTNIFLNFPRIYQKLNVLSACTSAMRIYSNTFSCETFSPVSRFPTLDDDDHWDHGEGEVNASPLGRILGHASDFP